MEWSRKRLAKELCRHWQWVDGRGRRKDFAARSLLLKLEARGVVTLPPLRLNQRRVRPAVAPLPCWLEPSPWTAALTEISLVRVERIQAGTPAAKRWAFYLDRYPYLGLRVVGENPGYVASDRHHREVGCVLFGAAAWRCAPRDRHLGWSSEERSRALGRGGQQHSIFRFAVGARAALGQSDLGSGGAPDRCRLASQVGARAGLAGEFCGSGTLCRQLLSCGQLALRGTDPRPQPTGSRSSTPGVSQGRISLRSEESEEAMNGLRQIEHAVLALGREWTRVELEKRL